VAACVSGSKGRLTLPGCTLVVLSYLSQISYAEDIAGLRLGDWVFRAAEKFSRLLLDNCRRAWIIVELTAGWPPALEHVCRIFARLHSHDPVTWMASFPRPGRAVQAGSFFSFVSLLESF
jgi:hypothetical protein